MPFPLEPVDPPADPPGEIGDGIGGGGTIGDGGDGGIGGGGTTGDGGDGGIGGGGIGGGDGNGDGTGGGGTIGGENEAPIIFGFDWSESGGIYQFFGYVSDDVDPTGMLVYFDGIISGAYCEVQAGGYFCFGITLEEPSGYVSALFIDGESLWSNQPTVTL